MLDLKNAPASGIIYALYKDKIVFKGYREVQDLEIDEDMLLELHLFDEEKEFRVIRSEKFGFIEMLISDDKLSASENDNHKYEEEIFVEDKYRTAIGASKVIMVNYIAFNDNDLLTISNYRLKKVV